MIDIVEVPAAPIVPPFPAVGSNNYNDEAYAAGVALPGLSAGIHAMAMATKTNATATHERALAADQAKTDATAQADAAMGYRNTTELHAVTATEKAAQATGASEAAALSQAAAQGSAAAAAIDAQRAEDAAAGIVDGPVTSVNGETGVVVLAPTHIAPLATQAEVESGALDDPRWVSPLRLAQAIAALAPVDALDLAVKRLSANVAINAFRISVNGGLTVQKMADGVVDEYEDQTGVDDPNCTGVAYDSAVDCYSTGPTYLATGGTGNRTASITVSTNITIIEGTIDNLVDGALTNDSSSGVNWTYEPNIPGKYVRFDFGVGNAKIVTEVTKRMGQTETVTRGFWKWQGSNNGSAWTDVSASQQLGAGLTDVFPFTGNATAYRYYQMIGVSGGVDGNGHYWVEIEFKIQSATTGVLLSDPSTALSIPTSALVVVWEEDVTAATLNTDLLAYASRETGRSFTTNFASSNKLFIASHGFLNDERVMVTSSAQNLPAGLSNAAMYYIVNKTVGDFELSLTSGGAAVAITSNGTGIHTVRRWAQATLAQAAVLSLGQILTGTADLTAQTAGTQMRYVLFAKNNKAVNFHGTALQWS